MPSISMQCPACGTDDAFDIRLAGGSYKELEAEISKQHCECLLVRDEIDELLVDAIETFCAAAADDYDENKGDR